MQASTGQLCYKHDLIPCFVIIQTVRAQLSLQLGDLSNARPYWRQERVINDHLPQMSKPHEYLSIIP